MTNSSQEEMFTHCAWYPSERELLLPPSDWTTSEYAELFRNVVKSSRPGPWRNENNPPLVGIMNAADRRGAFRNTRVIVICKGVQTGGSEAIYNIKHKRMDGSANNALVVMENERKVRRVMRQRILENIKRHGRLASQLSDNPDDTTNYSVIMRGGFCLNAGWAGSQASVSADPYETVILDEIDKYEVAMNIEEAKDRVTTYGETGLVLINSTPGLANGPIDKELLNCDTVMDYHAECPDCGRVQKMEFDKFWWPGQEEETKGEEAARRRANKILREKSARYVCAGCGVLWDDYARDKAVSLGLKHHFYGWKMREGIDCPASIGFHLPSWVSPFKSLSHIAARRLKAQISGQPGELRAWHNQEAAEPFAEKISERKEDSILALRDERPRGIVPPEISCLLILADTQQRGLFYEVRAFGYGPSLDSWQVREGWVESFAALEDVTYRSEYKDSAGKNHVISAGFIDSGGGTGTVPKHSRTAEVYEFCRRNPIFRPLKGRQRMTTTHSATQIDYYPRTKKPIPGGITLYNVNVTYFKDQLAAKLGINPDDPGAWRLHSECNEEYARHMVAEHKDEKGRWVCPNGKANHFWDIGVYALAAAEILQVKFWKKPGEGGTPPRGRRVLNRGVE